MDRQMILRVINYCDQSQFFSLRLVSKVFDSSLFERRRELWKTIDFSKSSKLNSSTLLMKEAKYAKMLILRGREDFRSDEVARFVKNNPILEGINLEECHWADDEIIAKIPLAKNLCSFNFSHCSGLTDTSFIWLSDKVEKILSFKIDGINGITDSVVGAITNKHCAHLQDFELPGHDISDGSFGEIVKCTNLNQLRVSCCQHLSDNSLEDIQSLKNLISLKMIKGERFTTEGLQRLFTHGSLHRLEELDFSESTQFDDDCVIQMVQCCGPTLKNLALSRCSGITDRGVISIADSCRNLEVLDISGLPEITRTFLTRVPTNMPKLRRLNLQQCYKITDESIKDLVAKMPKLTVINCNGEELKG